MGERAMLILIGILFILVVAATLILIATRRPKKEQPGELFRIREISITSLLGLMLWLEAGFILYYGIMMPERLITSSQAEINVYIFLILSILAGAFMLLYYFVKCAIVTKDGVIGISPLGEKTVLKWKEVASLKLNTGKRLTLINKEATKKITVGGEQASYKNFLRIACKEIPPEAGDDILRGLKLSMKL